MDRYRPKFLSSFRVLSRRGSSLPITSAGELCARMGRVEIKERSNIVRRFKHSTSGETTVRCLEKVSEFGVRGIGSRQVTTLWEVHLDRACR